MERFSTALMSDTYALGVEIEHILGPTRTGGGAAHGAAVFHFVSSAYYVVFSWLDDFCPCVAMNGVLLAIQEPDGLSPQPAHNSAPAHPRQQAASAEAQCARNMTARSCPRRRVPWLRSVGIA